MALRMETVAGDLNEELLVLMPQRGDRTVAATYVQRRRAWDRVG
ncbi:hypothetical protein [Skermanella sp. TT6]|nr:hypothetical protein [Skermanella sp. TT6]